MDLPTYFKNISKLSPESVEEFTSTFKREELPKGHFLFQPGEVCQKIYYVEKGIARVFYNSEKGKDITAWFFAENSFLTAVDSFYLNKPTRDYCELLEDSIIHSIKFSDMETMLNGSGDMARIAFYTLFEITKRLTEFIVSIKFQTASERYNTLIQEYPHIFNRVSLGHIASYLGITQETLSRIRAEK